MKITTITDLQKEYLSKIDRLDLDLIVAHILRKTREFILTHPEYKIHKLQIANCKLQISRRMRNEPLAYILGHKEFYGLDFRVLPATLIPRPETELLVEAVMEELEVKSQKSKAIIDIGTGSGNIIISLAKDLQSNAIDGHLPSFCGIDISNDALKVAKQNAKQNLVSEKIKFIHGNLLDKIKNIDDAIIIANLPYLSKKIYNATSSNVKKFEPKSALYSPKDGLGHYEKLLKQIAKFNPTNCIVFLEISPEQKISLSALIKKYLPRARINFQKDLAGKWRMCKIEI